MHGTTMEESYWEVHQHQFAGNHSAMDWPDREQQ